MPSYRLEDSSVELVCRYQVEAEMLGELDVKWYLDSSPSPWLVHLPHHWTLPHIVRGSRLADHVSQAGWSTPIGRGQTRLCSDAIKTQ